MDADITRFNQLLQEVEYHKPFTIVCLEPEFINLQVIVSLSEG